MQKRTHAFFIAAFLAPTLLLGACASLFDKALFRNIDIQEISRDPVLAAQAEQLGASVFANNCSSCHGEDGRGGVGFPDLTDGESIWPATLNEIQWITRYGIRSGHSLSRFSLMPSYGSANSAYALSESSIRDLVEKTLALAGLPHDAPSAARATATFDFACAECHGWGAAGNQEWYGAPSLTDSVWLYDSQPETIYQVIAQGRVGVSPAFEQVLSGDEIKAVSYYTYRLSL